MRFSVKVPIDTLCGKCRWAGWLTTDSRTLVQCDQFDREVRERVKDCSRFVPYGTLTDTELAASAWSIEVEESGKIGFMSPSERKRKKIPVW